MQTTFDMKAAPERITFECSRGHQMGLFTARPRLKAMVTQHMKQINTSPLRRLRILVVRCFRCC